MNYYDGTVFVLSCIGVIVYINHRLLHLPTTIAVMTGSLILSFLLIVINMLGYEFIYYRIFNSIVHLNFHELLMEGLLSFLLFACAINFNMQDLRKFKWEITITSSLSTLASIFIISIALFLLSHTLGLPIQLLF